LKQPATPKSWVPFTTAALALSASWAWAAPSSCADTQIRSIHTRLWDQEKGADFVEAGDVSLSFENGVYLEVPRDQGLF
jgi:hypothetical protein